MELEIKIKNKTYNIRNLEYYECNETRWEPYRKVFDYDIYRGRFYLPKEIIPIDLYSQIEDEILDHIKDQSNYSDWINE